MTRNKRAAIKADRAGEKNHEATVQSNLFQFKFSTGNAASPVPINAPITVCVPLMGMPNIEAPNMKLALEMLTLNMSESCCAGCNPSTPGSKVYASVLATF